MPYSPELCKQIENLALRLVVGKQEEDAFRVSTWMPALESIRDRARGEKATEVGRAVASLIEDLHDRSRVEGDANKLAVVLQDGVGRLQGAIDSRAEVLSGPDVQPAQDPELIGDFIMESREHLIRIEEQVLTIEREPSNMEALNSVFRGFHTIKGLAGFLELWEVQKLSHEVETVLDLARNAKLKLTPAAIDVILKGADYLRRWLAHLEVVLRNQSSEAPVRDESLLQLIRSLAEDPAEPAQMSGDVAALAAAVESGKPQEAPAPPTPEAATRRSEAVNVKVDTAKLDYLVDMAGEMVIAESLVRHDPELAALKSQKLQRKIAQLTRITIELQKTAMAMRLVPIGPLFRRMARLVRDLARQFGKSVEMETAGDEIELDRTIAEELADPLMHMVRNALDHGIESPEERAKSAKNPTARVLLKAYHQAGQVVVEISDDGRGLDRARIREKAVEKGLIGPTDELTDTEIYNLIFLPGFTTAASVTNVSGRGVGMDVVRRHIEKLRGRIETRSTPGCGSVFLLKLPLTLAIIDGLVVGVGKERYIVPLFAVREMFRPAQQTIWTVHQRSEMALVRGTLLPVRRLYQRFQVTPRSKDPLQSVLVVAEVEGQRYCLLVDELIGKQEVVIKSLGETFQHVAGIAGGAILGDGRVGLILDLDRLFKDQSVETR